MTLVGDGSSGSSVSTADCELWADSFGMTMPVLAVVSGVSIFVIGIVTIIVYVRLIEQGRKTLRNITG